MAVDIALLVERLGAETAELERILVGMDGEAWARPTPAPGWDVRDTIGHLAAFDDAAVRALGDPEGFRAERAAIVDVDTMVEEAVERCRAWSGPDLLDRLGAARRQLAAAALAAEPARRVPWYGPDMSVASFVTARTMETWAHGQDVADALGREHRTTAALADVADLCARTMPNSFRARGLEVPDVAVRVALDAPDGSVWALGDPDAAEVVRGDAVEFCLVCTQRRHVDDTSLRPSGPTARRWLELAQAFAGPPGPGRPSTATRCPMSTAPVRIANCSGFWGDRIDAPGELLAGPDPIDVLTGDYLAELTMYLLHKVRRRDPALGFATTFLRQMEEHLGTILDRGIKVVVNAGGLNPTGLADALTAQAAAAGLDPAVAVVTGDDILGSLPALAARGLDLANLDTGETLAAAGIDPVTANAYLGGWGIAAGLEAGADIVVCGRVTDAALVVGPGAWWHGWTRTDWDALAGAVVAGHVIECGPQATGGNYALAHELPDDDRLPGFPICELHADGSCVVTKQPGTGGAVTVGTVTAQLLYEIGGPRYANPDVVARFDTIAVEQEGPDRVRLSGVRGEPAPPDLKVAINHEGGWRNSMRMMITGLDVEAKAARATAQLWRSLGGREQFARAESRLVRSDHPDAADNAEAVAALVVEVADPDRAKVGRRFSNAVSALALSSYAGFFTLSPPGDASDYGVYWPTLVPADAVEHRVLLPDGTWLAVPPTPSGRSDETALPPPAAPTGGPAGDGDRVDEPTERAPLGLLCGARSGDKGGNANLGLWTGDDDRWEWLVGTLTEARLRELLPEIADLAVERHELPNLKALNFVIVGLLGEGVASSTRPDPQAKGLGEFLRSRMVDVPARFLAGPPHGGTRGLH